MLFFLKIFPNKIHVQTNTQPVQCLSIKNWRKKLHIGVYCGICGTDNSNKFIQDAVLSQGGPCNAAVNFSTYRSLQLHRVVFSAIAMFSN